MSRKKAWPAYNPKEIEPKWQQLWEQAGLYLAQEESGKPKFYCLDFFPYPSGDGLHVGHCRNYVPTDVLSRFKRMRGYNVLHPMGWDAFGEPAEQYAISHGVQPRRSIEHNTANFKRQLRIIGTSYDWKREINSSDPEYYRWTQWFFLLLYKRGLAYRDTQWQWWCPVCQTTLSSHEVSNGVCWRGHEGVTRRQIPAWYFKITAYADELVSGLDTIDWPEQIKAMQRNWVGRSEGIEIDFRTDANLPLTVYTTRPDTLFGVTFLTLAPEHPMVRELTTPELRSQLEAYLDQANRRSEVERMSETREKTGVRTGSFVTNPANGERIPVWVADYVLPTYGAGAVMGVPAHDQRDFEFARKFGLPLRLVIAPPEMNPIEELQHAYEGEGPLVNSDRYNGMPSTEAIERMGDDLEKHGAGRRRVQYRMHDWLISRQRYWGAPIPIIYCDTCGMLPVPEGDLPVLLPDMENFQPDGSGRSPLARLPEFVNTTCPECGGPAQRETDTMGGFACSSWYFLRFANPHYHAAAFDPDAVRYWLPVDVYVGGAEHAVLHLLYARFWIKVMADAGLISFREPFTKLLNQGQLMGPDGRRMSKSRGNVITPDAMVETYGADSLRVYELFMAPFDQDVDWNMDGIYGARRFLNKLWTLCGETYAGSAGAKQVDTVLENKLHQTIQAVTERLETLRLNTMVSALMEFTNILIDRQRAGAWQTATFHTSLETVLRLLAPAAPHMVEELWQATGHTGSVHQQPGPEWDAEAARQHTIEVAIQVNGKLRDVVQIPADAGQAQVEAQAMGSERIQPYLHGQRVDKIIYVPGKIFNIVVKPECVDKDILIG